MKRLVILVVLLLGGCFGGSWEEQGPRRFADPSHPSENYGQALHPSDPDYFQKLHERGRIEELEQRVRELESRNDLSRPSLNSRSGLR
jgi:hypothetical protein